MRHLLLPVAALWIATPAPSHAASQTQGDTYAFYEGELHFDRASDLRCTFLSHGSYKVFFATHKSAAGVEALMGGDQILQAFISGTDLSHLQVTYVGDSGPAHTMKVKSIGSTFVGSVESKTTVSELYGGCSTSKAEFKASLTGQDGGSAYQTYAEQFKLDAESEQDLAKARKGQINEALPRLRAALSQKAARLSTTHPQMLRDYYYLGKAYEETGQWSYAAYWYDKAVTTCINSYGVDNPCQVLTLGELGVSLATSGKFEEGEAAVRRALQVADRLTRGNHPSTWSAYNAIARIMIGSGRYAEAAPVVDRAMSLALRTTPSDLNVSSVKVTYAMLERMTGEYSLAEENLQQAITLAQKVQGADSITSINPRIGLAMLMDISGKDAQAEPIAKNALDEAVDYFGPGRPDHPTLSIARTTLANIYTAEGKYSDAEPLYRQATESNKRVLGPDHPYVAAAEVDWAKMLRLSGREKEALPLLQDAYRISHLSAAQGLRWHVPAQLMEVYSAGKTKNPVLAIFFGKEAVNLLQGVRGNLAQSGGMTQQGFVSSAEVKSVYLHLAQLLLADHRVSEAQQVLAMVSAEEMDQFLGQSVLANNTGVASASSGGMTPAFPATPSFPQAPKKPKAETDQTPTAVELSKSESQLADLAAEQVRYGQEYADLISKQQEQGDDFSEADKTRLKAVTAKVDDLSVKFIAAQAKVSQQSKDPEARKARKEEITAFTTAFEGTLGKMGHGAVVLEYFMMPDEVDIILTTPTSSVPMTSKISKKQLNKQIRDFRVALSDSHGDPLPSAQALYKVLVQPIAPALQAAHAKTLMLVLHDTLRYIPFAALHDGKRYLIESMAVVNINQASRDKLVSSSQSDWQMWGLGVTKQGADYPALPFAGEELNDIKAALGGSQVKLDQEFTESGLRGGLGGAYPVIHIASHFEFTPGSVDKSVLLLGDGHRMSLSEIQAKLNFNGVELLTLSACETAVGDDTMAEDGSEVEGLANVAQNKGAMAVIATLWPVADESTATLMNALYQAHKNEHMIKADALRNAQLALLHGTTNEAASSSGDEQRGLARREGSVANGGESSAHAASSGARYAHPFYWAPFILMGNWL